VGWSNPSRRDIPYRADYQCSESHTAVGLIKDYFNETVKDEHQKATEDYNIEYFIDSAEEYTD